MAVRVALAETVGAELRVSTRVPRGEYVADTDRRADTVGTSAPCPSSRALAQPNVSIRSRRIITYSSSDRRLDIP